ncbi:OmpH family outer membrane protein [Flammeovirgaceae bacterium KN852]|uniref:OmpH family outer membrane protein n=2 Tax=Marinigracilibium pacificum TaxID=2729599 RepID=A0A848J5J4_9BACT|nr:OmpH family outer membrane protein [Marinigracilibium pacificum]
MAAQGQQLKIGYTNVDYVLSNMPQMKNVQSEFETYQKQLQNQIQAKQNTLRERLTEYEQNVQANQWSDVVRADKERELQQMDQNLQKFAQDAQKSMQSKYTELLQPLYKQIEEAIQNVAKEGGYTHIFNSGTPGTDILLYADDDSDVTNKVFAKLGITPPPAE